MRTLFSLLTLVVSGFFVLNASAGLRTVAEIGQPAAGFPTGFIYWIVENPVIGEGGHVAFAGAADVSVGSTPQNTRAVWYGKPGQLETAIKAGESPAGFAANILFRDSIPGTLTLSDAGSIAFAAAMNGPNTRAAYLATVAGITHGIIQEGGIAPLFPPGTIMGNLQGFAFTDAGMAFSGLVGGSEIAIWFWDNSTTKLIATTGAEFSDLYPGCDFLGLQLIDLNQAGELLFYAQLITQGTASCPTWGLYTWKAGSFRKVVAEHDSATGMPADAFLSFPQNPYLRRSISINDNGDVSFKATLRDVSPGVNKEVSWMAFASGELSPVAIDGEAVPGSPSELIRLSTNSAPAANADATTVSRAISSTLADMILTGPPRQGTSASDFTTPGESHLEVLVRSDEPPPGFGSSWHLTDLEQPLLNNQGNIAFMAVARDALDPNTSATQGIWLGDTADNLRLLVATGRPVLIDGQPDELKQILAITPTNVAPSSSNSGQPIQLNDQGQLVFRATRLRNSFSSTLLMGMAATPACSGSKVTIPARTYADGEVIYCIGDISLSTLAKASVRVSNGADVTYESPALCLDKGFSVEKGGVFAAITP
ncbi:DUF7453 family protein [Thiolapillus sp.]|uniref:DUF7453 family protein n=2 Tax=Thiolapillus sp. TaxID=2017437 RepID=UPI003AF97B1D